MSQLDISISFSQLIGLLFCLYIFIYYVVIILNQFWYNHKSRFAVESSENINTIKKDNNYIIRKILKL